jgi:hypothetical protein
MLVSPRQLLVVALVSLMMVTGVNGEVYRWVDANGKVHFSDKAPTSSGAGHGAVKVETLDLPEQGPAYAAPDISESERMQRQQRLVNMLEQERLAKQRAKAEAKQKEQELASRCERFRNRLKYMDEVNRFYKEQPDGTRTYLNDAEADKLRADRKRQYVEECGGG